MEFGPRALGARSILGDARSPTMQTTLNLKVKYRESSGRSRRRCCAKTSRLVRARRRQPYMLLVADVQAKHRRAMTPTSSSSSASTSSTCRAPRFRRSPTSTIPRAFRPCTARPTRASMRLIALSRHITGCPVLVNTSFNVRGEPIVCTPEDASAASWARRSSCWWSAIASCKRKIRMSHSSVITGTYSILTRPGMPPACGSWGFACPKAPKLGRPAALPDHVQGAGA